MSQLILMFHSFEANVSEIKLSFKVNSQTCSIVLSATWLAIFKQRWLDCPRVQGRIGCVLNNNLMRSVFLGQTVVFYRQVVGNKIPAWLVYANVPCAIFHKNTMGSFRQINFSVSEDSWIKTIGKLTCELFVDLAVHNEMGHD